MTIRTVIRHVRILVPFEHESSFTKTWDDRRVGTRIKEMVRGKE